MRLLVEWAGVWGVLLRTYNLRQVQRIVSDGVEDQILQFVDDSQQILAERSHFGGVVGLRALWMWSGRVRGDGSVVCLARLGTVLYQPRISSCVF